jgi:hypothetical protein
VLIESFHLNKGLPAARVSQLSGGIPLEKFVPSQTAVASKVGAV